MPSLYKRKDSPFWWMEFKDTAGRRKCASTGMRYDSAEETRRAREYRAIIESKELSRPMAQTMERWEHWVEPFLRRHCQSPRTLDRYLECWKWMLFFLTEHKIETPRQIHYRHAIEYLEWRKSFKHNRKKCAGHNTALLELKTLSVIMQEAVKLGFAQGNPISKLGIHREKPKEKPALSDDEILKIRKALVKESEWMQIAFEIALHTGCRLRETNIPMNCIDWKRGTITFPSPKGGNQRAFTIIIPKKLKPLLRRLRNSGRQTTLNRDKIPSGVWTKFFRHNGLSHLCFHCTRVNYITRLVPANVPEVCSMRLVNHASTTIHRIYQRLGVEDVRPYVDAIALPTLSAAKAQNRHKK